MRASIMRMIRFILTGISAVLVLGCETLPTVGYTTSEGCGIALWPKEWVQNNVTTMSWTGDCGSGLAQGQGTLIVKLYSGQQVRYEGEMKNGLVKGNGTYTTENGWKLQGNFLELNMFVSGKVFNGKGQIVFDGSMMHNEKYNGKTITFSDARYYRGIIYFTDGSYINDGEYTGSSGPYLGTASIDVNSGKGIAYGQLIKDGNVVARFVDGVRYDDDRTYQSAKLAYLDKLLTRIQAENDRATEAFKKERAEKNARETSEALGQAFGTIGQIQQNKLDRKQVAHEQQQRLQLAQQEQQRTTQSQQSQIQQSQATSRSRPANHCVHIVRNPDNGAKLANDCSFPVEVAWCVQDYDCRHRTWGFTNTWSIKAGGSYGVSGSKDRNVFAFACDKPNARIIEYGQNQSACKD